MLHYLARCSVPRLAVIIVLGVVTRFILDSNLVFVYSEAM